MNDLARETLVKAAMTGVRQIRGQLYEWDGGFCAVGVLLHALGDMGSTYMTWASPLLHTKLLHTKYDISKKEYFEIVRANDDLRWDFLTIARKCGQKEPINHG